MKNPNDSLSREFYTMFGSVPPTKDYSPNEKCSASPYEKFLHSKYWRDVCDVVIVRDKNRCVLCGSPEKLNVHHNTYAHHFDELNHLEDLVTLCHRCHMDFHYNCGRLHGRDLLVEKNVLLPTNKNFDNYKRKSKNNPHKKKKKITPAQEVLRGVHEIAEFRVLNRDGERCVICGSANRVKVVHTRQSYTTKIDTEVSRMNTLCRECYNDYYKDHGLINGRLTLVEHGIMLEEDWDYELFPDKSDREIALESFYYLP